MKQTLKIGDTIYKYLSFNGFGEYIVIAVKEMKECYIYEVECQKCTDHDKCTMYVSDEGKGIYKFLSMTNNNGEDDSPQEYWHNDRLFYSSLKAGKIAEYNKCICDRQKDIDERASLIERLKVELEELKQHLSNIEVKP
jgi:hypothetical protein